MSARSIIYLTLLNICILPPQTSLSASLSINVSATILPSNSEEQKNTDNANTIYSEEQEQQNINEISDDDMTSNAKKVYESEYYDNTIIVSY